MNDLFQAAAQGDVAHYLQSGIEKHRDRQTLKAYLFERGGFAGAVSGLYDEPERLFLLDVVREDERAFLGFRFFGLLPASERAVEARRIAGMQPRAVWLEAGVPRGLLHSDIDPSLGRGGSLGRLAAVIYRDHPQRELIADAARYPDYLRAVVGDTALAECDRARLDPLVLRLLTRAARRQHPLAEGMLRGGLVWAETTVQAEDIRLKARDLVRLETLLEAANARYNARLSGDARYDSAIAKVEAQAAGRLGGDRARSFAAGILEASRQGADIFAVWDRACRAIGVQRAPAQVRPLAA